MHDGAKLLVVAALVALGIASVWNPLRALAAAGLTVAPATMTVRLAPGTAEQSVEFSLTNHYAAPVTLRFSFEPRLDALTNGDPAKHLTISLNNLTVKAGETVKPVVTLHDSSQLSPGSHLADLIVAQTFTAGPSVDVLPSLRLPLIIIKEDGAVASLSLVRLVMPRFSLSVPAVAQASIRNSGNLVAIPRGVVTITSPTGKVVSRGALNTASLAVSPGGEVRVDAGFTRIASARWPGFYTTTIEYGLGGGQATTRASSRFLYVAWWHLVLLLVMIAAAVYYRKHQHHVHHILKKKLRRRKKR